MTRINANIDPEDLLDSHLIAEYREIVRIPNVLNKLEFSKITKTLEKAPNEFKLGTGHVLYHYDKIKYLHDRFLSITAQMDNRGIANVMTDCMFENCKELHPTLYNEFPQNQLNKANHLITLRIIERVQSMKYIKVNKENIDKELYIARLANKYLIANYEKL